MGLTHNLHFDVYCPINNTTTRAGFSIMNLNIAINTAFEQSDHSNLCNVDLFSRADANHSYTQDETLLKICGEEASDIQLVCMHPFRVYAHYPPHRSEITAYTNEKLSDIFQRAGLGQVEEVVSDDNSGVNMDEFAYNIPNLVNEQYKLVKVHDKVVFVYR